MSTVRVASGRRWIWMLAAGALAIAGITGLTVRSAVADPVLPPLTPAELLTKVAQAQPAGMSATFEQRSDLGLPSLSGVGGDDLQSVLSLLTGDHTVRVWLAGTDKSRVALVDGSAETAAIRNGGDLWLWSSEKQQARHGTVTSDKPTADKPSTTPTSPTEAVQKLLAAVEPSTNVAVSGTGTVAGRPVYQLVLTPKDDASLVGQVRVSVDATEFVPLGAQVFADDGSEAISVAATSVDFSVPDASIFAFTPPPGAEVSELKPPATSGEPAKEAAKPKLVGSGWTTVAVTKLGGAGSDQTVSALLKTLPEVSGSWGKGRLLSTTLVNAVISDDGRVAVGSVTPERLYAALSTK